MKIIKSKLGVYYQIRNDSACSISRMCLDATLQYLRLMSKQTKRKFIKIIAPYHK